MNNSLSVFWGTSKVGRLWLTTDRRFIFQYSADWIASPTALPISLRLPVKAEPYENDSAKPFFINLLPEADMRDMIAKGLGVSEKNDFKLLEELAGDCAGALSLLPEGRSPQKDGGYTPIPAAEIDRMIDAMPQRPLLVAQEGLRLSLAGAQQKLPLFHKDGEYFLPVGASASSHILKPAIARFKDTVENEFFCMRLAAACGLPVPRVHLREGKNRALLVERYDRTLAAGEPVRLHQEDFCQALGYSYEQKYEDKGGASLKECFDLLERHSSQPIIDKRALLRWVVFNYLIGNRDSHAKNISMLITRDGMRLAPFYDVMSTAIYPELSPNLAMKIGGEKRPDRVMKRHWERLAEDAGVAAKAVLGICGDLEETLPSEIAKLEKDFSPEYGAADTIGAIKEHVAAAVARLETRLAEKVSPEAPSRIESSNEPYGPEIRAADEFLYPSVGSRFTHHGGWEVRAFPSGYEKDRLPDPRDVKRRVAASEVEFRGWNLPHTDKEHAGYFLNGFQSLTAWERYVEGYRAYQSGLVVWKRVFFEDLEERKDARGRRVLSYVNLIWETTEILFFLKNYYAGLEGADKVHLRLGLHGTLNRCLVSLEPGVDLRSDHVSGEPEIILEEELDRKELADSPDRIANRLILRTLLIFGADDIGSGVVADWQKRLISRKS